MLTDRNPIPENYYDHGIICHEYEQQSRDTYTCLDYGLTILSASQVGGSSKSELLNSDLIVSLLLYYSKEN